MKTRAIRFGVILSWAGAIGLRAQDGEARTVYEAGPVQVQLGAEGNPSDQVDERVFSRLDELGIPPAQLCSEAVFLRRAFLAVIGTLPTEAEARAFLEGHDPNRRGRLIDHLLQRDEFAEYWAMKWGDLLRVKAEFPIKLWPNAVQAYHRHILASMRANKPFHEFTRELLTANGSNFRVGQVNFYRAMQDRSPHGIAATVALTFLGERAEKWPPKKLDALAGFFAQLNYKATGEWKEEIVFYDPKADKDGLAKGAMFPDGTPAKLADGQDPRVVFADWLLRPDNAWFSRNLVNRVWSWLMGRGIVHEPDDFRADNPPSNPALLEFLQHEFVTTHCDMKHLFRVILNSQVFQLASIPAQDTPEAAANFAHYPLRRLEAEVLIDALNQVTGTREGYSSPIPEPFTWVPDTVRAIALADGSITSSFLELFGRPPRDTGYESERSRSTSAAQRLHLLNSTHVLNKIQACPLVAGATGTSAEDLEKLTERVYFTVLSRPPTPAERDQIQKYAGSAYAGGKQLAADVVWALINQPEFYFLH
jgi:hypothetical protein